MDPSLVKILKDHKGLSPDDVDMLMNKKSGLLGRPFILVFLAHHGRSLLLSTISRCVPGFRFTSPNHIVRSTIKCLDNLGVLSQTRFETYRRDGSLYTKVPICVSETCSHVQVSRRPACLPSRRSYDGFNHSLSLLSAKECSRFNPLTYFPSNCSPYVSTSIGTCEPPYDHVSKS